jgi:hypothetical protein
MLNVVNQSLSRQFVDRTQSAPPVWPRSLSRPHGDRPMNWNVTQEATAVLGAVVFGQAVFVATLFTGFSPVVALVISSLIVGMSYHEFRRLKPK